MSSEYVCASTIRVVVATILILAGAKRPCPLSDLSHQLLRKGHSYGRWLAGQETSQKTSLKLTFSQRIDAWKVNYFSFPFGAQLVDFQRRKYVSFRGRVYKVGRYDRYNWS